MRFGERDGHQIFLEPEGLNVVVEPSSTRLFIESVANPPPCVPRTCAYPPPPRTSPHGLATAGRFSLAREPAVRTRGLDLGRLLLTPWPELLPQQPPIFLFGHPVGTTRQLLDAGTVEHNDFISTVLD